MALVSVAQSAASAQGGETKPVFDLDCMSFAGRFLGGAPVKKKTHPGLAVDGTAWMLSPQTKTVMVTKVFAGEAAEKAGVEVGDQVISVNGYLTSGSQFRDVFCSYHMYQPDTLMETLKIQKKDGTQKILNLQLLTLDKCNPEEKTTWLDIYKSLGY